MFDMGFTEMLLIGIVALVVIGPEKLPGVARTAGKYFTRLKRFMTNVKADVENELRADELREILNQQQKELDSLKSAVSDVGKEVSDVGKEIEMDIESTLDSVSDDGSGNKLKTPSDESAVAASSAEPEKAVSQDKNA